MCIYVLKAGLADDRSWSLSGYWPRKCDRPKGHNYFVSLNTNGRTKVLSLSSTVREESVRLIIGRNGRE